MIGAVVIAALGIGVAAGQDLAPRFEVASIKSTSSEELDAIKRSGRSSLFPEQGISISGNRVTVLGLTVATLIRAAYNLRTYQFSGGPGWIASDSFDISAKAEGPGTITFDEARRMLQALLVDRLQLRFHRETKESVAYALIVGKNGPKLKESLVHAYSTHVTASATQVHMTVSGANMAQLCSRLSTFVGRPVVDRTNVAGTFDLKLDFATEGLIEAASSEPREFSSIFTALQEQLGLRLELTRAPVEILVVDRVERASDN
jgi:uncharacterized protein (TIGR03435 family)